MHGKQFAPTHAPFALTNRVADPHTDPEANYSERKGKRDQQGHTDRGGTKTYKLNGCAPLRMNGPFTQNLGCPWRRNCFREGVTNSSK